jgi:hypothetical protein
MRSAVERGLQARADLEPVNLRWQLQRQRRTSPLPQGEARGVQAARRVSARHHRVCQRWIATPPTWPLDGPKASGKGCVLPGSG